MQSGRPNLYGQEMEKKGEKGLLCVAQISSASRRMQDDEKKDLYINTLRVGMRHCGRCKEEEEGGGGGGGGEEEEEETTDKTPSRSISSPIGNIPAAIEHVFIVLLSRRCGR